MPDVFQRSPRPILVPSRDVAWASGAVFNPGAVLDADAGLGIGLASTTDWRTVERYGRIGPAVRDKDAALLPGRCGAAGAVPPHRSRHPGGVVRGRGAPPGAGLRELGAPPRPLDDHVVMRPERPWEGKKIGIGPPPVWTPEGWLVVYHGVDAGHVYRTGLALLDEDLRVVARTRHPVLEPRHDFEREGDVLNVVFPTDAVVEGGVLRLFYGAAGTAIGQAWAQLADVLARLHQDRG